MICRRTFLTIAGGALLAPRFVWAATEVPLMLDHILLGCSDLDQGIAYVEQHTGVRPAIGGVHPGRGTRNALLSLGELHYLEVIAPDPAQAGMKISRESMVRNLKSLSSPQIFEWAVHTSDISSVADRWNKAGIAFDGPTLGSRKRPDGKVLSWQTLNLQDNQNGLLPFFIQWGADSIHPSVDSPHGCRLTSFALSGPDLVELAAISHRIGIQVELAQAPEPRLTAKVVGPRGTLSLSS
jgi:hypothetical protein